MSYLRLCLALKPGLDAIWLAAAEEAGAHEYNDEAEEEEGMGLRQSSGLSHLPGYGGEEAEAGRSRKRRPIKGSGRAAGKGSRRRRLDEEDEQAEELRANRKRRRGEPDQPLQNSSCAYTIRSKNQCLCIISIVVTNATRQFVASKAGSSNRPGMLLRATHQSQETLTSC